MRSPGFLVLAIAASNAMGAVLPIGAGLPTRDLPVPDKNLKLDARAELEYRAELEERGLHASCIISMASCLATYGLSSFKYQETKIAHAFYIPWALCTSSAILSGACADGIGNTVLSEPAQMFTYHREHGLVDNIDCTGMACAPNINSCPGYACGPCTLEEGPFGSDLFGLAPIWSGRLAPLCIGCGSGDFAAGVAWI